MQKRNKSFKVIELSIVLLEELLKELIIELVMEWLKQL